MSALNTVKYVYTICMSHFSIKMNWIDKRYANNCAKLNKTQEEKCVSNHQRKGNCPSNYVLWTERNQFWLPGLNVENAISLVMTTIEKETF